MEVELRRYQNYLQCSGIAVILFAVWGSIKSIAFLISNWGTWLLSQPEEIQQILETALARIIIIFILGFFSLITIMIHFWLGKGAIFESRGKRLKRPYVAGAVLLAILTITGIFLSLFHAVSEGENDAITVNSTILDLSLLLALGEMIHAAWKVRKLTKQSEQKEA